MLGSGLSLSAAFASTACIAPASASVQFAVGRLLCVLHSQSARVQRGRQSDSALLHSGSSFCIEPRFYHVFFREGSCGRVLIYHTQKQSHSFIVLFHLSFKNIYIYLFGRARSELCMRSLILIAADRLFNCGMDIVP